LILNEKLHVRKILGTILAQYKQEGSPIILKTAHTHMIIMGLFG